MATAHCSAGRGRGWCFAPSWWKPLFLLDGNATPIQAVCLCLPQFSLPPDPHPPSHHPSWSRAGWARPHPPCLPIGPVVSSWGGGCRHPGHQLSQALPAGRDRAGRGREFKVAGQGNAEALSHVTLNLHQRQRKECWAGGPWGPALAVTGGPFCAAQCLTSGGGDMTEDACSLQACPPSPHPGSRAPSRPQWPPADLSTHAGLRAARGGCEALWGPGEGSRDPGRAPFPG